MIKISKQEAIYLAKLGFSYGNHIHKTVSSGKKATYYATESKKVLSQLAQFNANNLVATYK